MLRRLLIAVLLGLVVAVGALVVWHDREDPREREADPADEVGADAPSPVSLRGHADEPEEAPPPDPFTPPPDPFATPPDVGPLPGETHHGGPPTPAPPGPPVRIQVLDEDGEPVQGLRLKVTWASPVGERHLRPQTGEDGIATCPGVAPGMRLRIATVWEAGMPDVPLGEHEAVFEEGELIVLRSPAAVALRGSVVDEEGRPVPWGTVTAAREDGEGDEGEAARAVIREGRFELRRLRSERYRLQARGPPDRAASEPVVVLAPRDDVRLILPRTYTLRGRVVAESPRDTEVTWYGPHGETSSTRPGRDGSFEIAGLRDEAGTLLVVETLGSQALARLREVLEYEAEPPDAALGDPQDDLEPPEEPLLPLTGCALLDDVRPSGAPIVVRLEPRSPLTVTVTLDPSADVPEGAAPPSLSLVAVRGRVRLPLRRGVLEIHEGVWFEEYALHVLPPGTWHIEARRTGEQEPLATQTVSNVSELDLEVPW